MLLGASILGAVASKKYSSISDAMKALIAAGQVCTTMPEVILYHSNPFLFWFFHFVHSTKVEVRNLI